MTAPTLQIKRLEERIEELEAVLREISTRMYSDGYGDLYVCFDENLLAKLDALQVPEQEASE